MNLIQEIKALFAFKDVFEEIEKEALVMNGSQPGWKTSEFWLNVAAQIGTLWGAVSGFIPPKYAAIISTAGVALYTIARTVAKAISDIQAAKAVAPAALGDTATANVTVKAS